MANLSIPRQIVKDTKKKINQGVGVVNQLRNSYNKSWNNWKASPRYKKIQNRMDKGIY